MARKINPDSYGSSTPKIRQEDLEEDVAVVTIASFDEAMVDDDDAPEGKRRSAYLTFAETGDKVLWLNKTQIVSLVEKLGDNVDNWIGEQVPIRKHTSTFGSKKYPKVIVCPAEEWDEYLGGRRKKVGGKRGR